MLRPTRYWLMCAVLIGCDGMIGEAGDPAEVPDGPSESAACEADALASPIGLRRLTRTQFQRSVEMVVGLPVEAITLPSDSHVNGFSSGGIVNDDDVRLYRDAAESAASQAAATVFAACEGTTADCANEFVDRVGRRAFRRPLSEEEHAAYRALFDGALASTPEEQAEVVLSAMLASPNFLYRVELSTSTEVRALTGFEVASRLSFLLRDTGPDDALLDLAAAGGLDHAEGVVAAAAAMLDDPDRSPAISRFFMEWLELDGPMSKSEALFGEFTDEVRQAARAEARFWVEESFYRRDGTLDELLSGDFIVAGEQTAPLYGLTHSGPAAVLDVPDAQLGGVLRSVMWLAEHATPEHSSPIARGVFVRERLFCQDLPAPPPGVDALPVDRTLPIREVLAAHRADPSCAGCHDRIDSLGLPFEEFDAIGRWRDAQHGEDLDVSGGIVGTSDVDGDINGSRELMDRVAHSQTTARCASEQWFRFALGRRPTAEERCIVDEAADVFVDSGLQFRSLILSLVASDAFRYRTPIEEER